eukprot:GHVT01007123.1.p1 GENE.GHVT01007123.1~~GHVT01007123.1.p1  ORF type:complete len:258 (+),score=59.97 GHVT01007123.1:413-1186(+)
MAPQPEVRGETTPTDSRQTTQSQMLEIGNEHADRENSKFIPNAGYEDASRRARPREVTHGRATQRRGEALKQQGEHRRTHAKEPQTGSSSKADVVEQTGNTSAGAQGTGAGGDQAASYLHSSAPRGAAWHQESCLQASAALMLRSALGHYCRLAKSLKFSRWQVPSLVASILRSFGMDEPPAVTKQLAARLQILDAPGLRWSYWSPSRTSIASRLPSCEGYLSRLNEHHHRRLPPSDSTGCSCGLVAPPTFNKEAPH